LQYLNIHIVTTHNTHMMYMCRVHNTIRLSRKSIFFRQYYVQLTKLAHTQYIIYKWANQNFGLRNTHIWHGDKHAILTISPIHFCHGNLWSIYWSDFVAYFCNIHTHTHTHTQTHTFTFCMYIIVYMYIMIYKRVYIWRRQTRRISASAAVLLLCTVSVWVAGPYRVYIYIMCVQLERI